MHGGHVLLEDFLAAEFLVTFLASWQRFVIYLGPSSQRLEFTDVNGFAEMFCENLVGQENLIAVAAVVIQGILTGVFSVTIAAMILRRVLGISDMVNMLAVVWEIDIALLTMEVTGLCLVGSKFVEYAKSRTAMLAGRMHF